MQTQKILIKKVQNVLKCPKKITVSFKVLLSMGALSSSCPSWCRGGSWSASPSAFTFAHLHICTIARHASANCCANVTADAKTLNSPTHPPDPSVHRPQWSLSSPLYFVLSKLMIFH